MAGRILRTSLAERMTGSLNWGLARTNFNSCGHSRSRVFSQKSLTCLPAGRWRKWLGCLPREAKPFTWLVWRAAFLTVLR